MDHEGPWPSPEGVAAFAANFCRNESTFCEEGNKKRQKNHIKKDFLEKVNKIKLVDWENLDYKAFAKKFYIRYFSGKMPY